MQPTSARAACIDEMQRWSAAFNELVPQPTPAEAKLLADRLSRFAGDLLEAAAIDGADIDRDAFADLMNEIERLAP